MADYSNISSEQDLQGLLDEGKINVEDYQQLLTAMQTSSQDGEQTPEPEPKQKDSKQKLALIGFCLMLAGFVLPIMLYCIVELVFLANNPDLYFRTLPFLMGVLMEIAALTIAIIAWPERLAKVTLITIGIAIVLGILTIV